MIEIDSNLKRKLVLGKDIPFKDLLIKQATLEVIDTIGEDTFFSYIYPYTLTLDSIQLPDEFKNGFNVYDLLFIIDEINRLNNNFKEEESLVNMFKSSLYFFFDTDDIIHLDKSNVNSFMINHRTMIDRNDFEDLAELILLICRSKKIEIKKEKDIFAGKSEEWIKRYKRHLEKREKYKKKHKNDDGLYRIINAVIHFYQSTVDYRQLDKWTYWQLINTYETFVNKEKYLYNLSLLTVITKEEAKKLDLKHWSEKLNIK